MKIIVEETLMKNIQLEEMIKALASNDANKKAAANTLAPATTTAINDKVVAATAEVAGSDGPATVAEQSAAG